MDPSVWGKHGWIFLHSVTMAYPDFPSENDKQNYKNFFNLLTVVLPCSVCREHLKQYINETPIEKYLSCKKKLVEWLIYIHNQTNKSLGKPILSYQEVIEIYKKLYNEKETKIDIKKENIPKKVSNLNYIVIAIILGIIIIALFIWKKKSVLFV